MLTQKPFCGKFESAPVADALLSFSLDLPVVTQGEADSAIDILWQKRRKDAGQ